MFLDTYNQALQEMCAAAVGSWVAAHQQDWRELLGGVGGYTKASLSLRCGAEALSGLNIVATNAIQLAGAGRGRNVIGMMTHPCIRGAFLAWEGARALVTKRSACSGPPNHWGTDCRIAPWFKTVPYLLWSVQTIFIGYVCNSKLLKSLFI